MRAFSGRRNALVLVIVGVTAMSDFMAIPGARAGGFIDDSTSTDGIYYWQRERDRKDVIDGDKYKTNPSHSTWNTNLDSQSDYVTDTLGLDIIASIAIETAENGGSSHPNEITFSKGSKAYDEDWSGDKDGISPYKAAAKFRYGPAWARVGYIQPTGRTLLVPHWSFTPDTYQGVEAGANFDYDDTGVLSFSYMWTNKYKAPWYLEMDEFYRNDKATRIDYLHSLRMRYDFKNNSMLEAAFDQAGGYIGQYFAEAGYEFDIAGSPLTTSYQFYSMRDKTDDHNISDLYDGTTWLQALTFGYRVADVADLHLEGTWVKANSRQGCFLQRMTPTYASSSDRPDIWWGSRSNFNANGEKAIFFGTVHNLKNWDLPGFAIDASYVYAWDVKPAIWQSSPDAYYDENQIIEESAYSLDAVYTIQGDYAKGTMLKLHSTEYNNHPDIPSQGGSYGSVSQDECDVKFMVVAPFAIL